MAYQIKPVRRSVGAIVLLLWLASLALPAATFSTKGYEYVPGAAVAVMGLFAGWAMAQPGAFANPIFLFLCFALLLAQRPPFWLAVIAEVLALWSFTWSSYPDDVHQNLITHFASGFYFWQLAILIVAVYAGAEDGLVWNDHLTSPDN